MNLSPETLALSAVYRIEIGKRLRSARVGIGKPQDELAQHLGIARQTLGGYENGETEPLSSILKRVCEDFGVDPAWLLIGDVSHPMFSPNARSGRVQPREAYV